MDVQQGFTLFVLLVTMVLSFVLRQLIRNLQELKQSMHREITGFALQLVEENPSLENYLHLGLVCFRCECFEEALKWFEKLWDERVFRKEAGFWMVLCCVRLNYRDRALKIFRQLPREEYSRADWLKLQHALAQSRIGRLRDFFFRILTTQVSLPGPFLGSSHDRGESWQRIQAALPARYQNLCYLQEDQLSLEFEAQDQHLKRQVRLKVARPGLSESGMEEFLEHPRILAKLSSKAFPQVYDLQQGSQCFYSLEVFEGTHLSRLLTQMGRQGRLEVFLRLFLAMAHHLEELHVQQITLCRLEPADIFWDEERATLCFGGQLRRLSGEGSPLGQAVVDLFCAELQCHEELRDQLPSGVDLHRVEAQTFQRDLRLALEEFMASRMSRQNDFIEQLQWLENIHRACIHALKGKFSAVRRYFDQPQKLIQTFFRKTNLEDLDLKLRELQSRFASFEASNYGSRLPIVDEVLDLDIEQLRQKVFRLGSELTQSRATEDALEFLQIQNQYFDRLSDRLADFLQEHGFSLGKLLESLLLGFWERDRVELRLNSHQQSLRLAGTRIHEFREALLRSLENLLNNALEAKATHIVLSVEQTVAGWVDLRIQDNGGGVPASLIREFEEASGYRFADRGGTGLLGCRSMIEAHAGQMRIEALEEVGTRVTVSLPCYIA